LENAIKSGGTVFCRSLGLNSLPGICEEESPGLILSKNIVQTLYTCKILSSARYMTPSALKDGKKLFKFENAHFKMKQKKYLQNPFQDFKSFLDKKNYKRS
jgi:hypothetical protein